MRMLAVGLVSVIAAPLAGCGSNATAGSRRAELATCAGKPETKPETVVLTCADAGITADHLHWTHWGDATATGEGRAAVNSCSPDCATAGYHFYDVVLLASHLTSCPNGRSAYLRIKYA